MTLEELLDTVRLTLGSGPYEVAQNHRVVAETDGEPQVLTTHTVGYADPSEDVVVTQVTIDLGDDEPLEPVTSWYTQGSILQPDGEGNFLELDVAGIGSTILAPLVWLTGAVSVEPGADGDLLVDIRPAEILTRAAPAERDQLETALSMAERDLLDSFAARVAVADGRVSRVLVSVDWAGRSSDGTLAEETDLTLVPTPPRTIALPETIGAAGAEEYLWSLLAPR